ncbi:MAG: hypothetical protein ABFD07_14475 [Methanobacterium sp.]
MNIRLKYLIEDSKFGLIAGFALKDDAEKWADEYNALIGNDKACRVIDSSPDENVY